MAGSPANQNGGRVGQTRLLRKSGLLFLIAFRSILNIISSLQLEVVDIVALCIEA